MNKKREVFIWLILIAMATALSCALDKYDKNMILIGLMVVIPFLLVFQYPYIRKSENLIYLLPVVIMVSAVLHPDSFRISTILYTMMFLLTFLYYLRLITTVPLQIYKYIAILKSILIAYFVVLIIQQLAVFTNSPYIPNFNAGEIKIFKLNALSPEASHSARIVAVLMYSYICMVELKTGRSYNLMTDGWKNKYIWFVFLYLMLTMQSGFAIVMLFFIALKTLETKNIFFYFPPLFIIGGFVFYNIEPYVFERVIRFGKALFTFDTATLISTDHSASVRLIPMIAYFQTFDVLNINTWLGFGTDYTANLIPTLMPGVPEGKGLGGFFPGFFWDRGLICAGIALAMIYKYCIIKSISFDTIFFLLLILTPSLNTQLFWISIMVFTTNKYFYQTTKIHSTKPGGLFRSSFQLLNIMKRTVRPMQTRG